MPRGRSPTLTDLTTSPFATSTMSTESASSALTYSHLPSGLKTACSGFLPRIRMLRATLSAAVSTSSTWSFSSIAAEIHLPSGDR